MLPYRVDELDMAGGDATSRRVYGKIGRSAKRLLLPSRSCMSPID